MANKKKWIYNLIFLFLLFGFTIYQVFHGKDMKALLHILSKVKPHFMILALIFVLVFIWCESFIIHYMLGTLQILTKKWTCFLYSCVGFFFSCITPSATGGQPAQIYYMKKNDIPIPISTLVLMIVTITYKFVLVLTGLYIIIFQQPFIHKYLQGILPLFYLGIALNIFCCTSMMVLVFHPLLAKNIMLYILKFLYKIHLVNDIPGRTEKMNQSMNQYNETAVYLKKHFKIIVHVLFISIIQRFILFFVTCIVYRALGLHRESLYTIAMLQAVISITVDMLPLPGGMGISEQLFLKIFANVFGPGLLLPGMILSRGIAYYMQLLFCAVMTVFAHFTIGTSKNNQGKTSHTGCSERTLL